MLRIGAVEYLNTKPLVYGLHTNGNDFRLEFDLPSRLADRMARDDLDVALIPSIEFLLRPDYEIVCDAVIACRGPVRSVRLMSRVPMREIKSVALDEGSRTSAVLTRVLLWEEYGLKPALLPLPIQQSPEEVDADAVLVIGDRAMQPSPNAYREIWDLGDRWCHATGLPFVFAMWVARAGVDVASIAECLSLARDEGVAHAADISKKEAGPHGLTFNDCFSYLTESLYFHFGPRELQGLRLFARRAAFLGILPPDIESRIVLPRRSAVLKGA